MSIVTRTGDRGKTSLLWGARVNKDDICVEAYGILDEVCSFLGLSKSLIKDKAIKETLGSIQRDLSIIGAEIAAEPEYIGKLERRIGNKDVNRLEKIIKELESRNKFEERCFYLPGETSASAALDIARTVTRRAERKAVSLERKGLLKNAEILVYLNRLSDLLYLFARISEKKPRRLRYE
jgi:cob(I)alamin adenosyltransferase